MPIARQPLHLDLLCHFGNSSPVVFLPYQQIFLSFVSPFPFYLFPHLLGKFGLSPCFFFLTFRWFFDNQRVVVATPFSGHLPLYGRFLLSPCLCFLVGPHTPTVVWVASPIFRPRQVLYCVTGSLKPQTLTGYLTVYRFTLHQPLHRPTASAPGRSSPSSGPPGSPPPRPYTVPGSPSYGTGEGIGTGR